MTFRIEALRSVHDRAAFSCGDEALDRYLKERATQDVRRRVANVYVALTPDDRIAAYYTLSATSIEIAELPAEDVRRLPRYRLVPVALVGRLAVSEEYQKRGLGGALILDAAKRADVSALAVYALVVEAKNETAVLFYEHLQFRALQGRRDKLFLPLATALAAARVEN